MTFCWNSAVAVTGVADSGMRSHGKTGYAGLRNGFKMPGCRKLAVGGDDAITKANPLMVTAEQVDRMSKPGSRSASAPDILIRSNLNLPG